MTTATVPSARNKFQTFCVGAIFISFCITIASCFEKIIKPGIQTTVTGTVTDLVRKKPLQGVLVFIEGCYDERELNVGYHCGGIIDSVRSDSNGKFELHFTSDGTTVGYKFDFMPDINFTRRYPDPAMDISVGKSNTFDIVIQQLTVLKEHVTIDSNSVGDIQLNGTYQPNYSKQIKIYKSTRDTIIYPRVWPDDGADLLFATYDSIHQRGRGYDERFNTLLQDTIFHETHIVNPLRWN